MKNPMLLKVKFDAGIPLKQLITEQNHNDVVSILIERDASHHTDLRVAEYVKEILPKAYKNEDPKLRLLEKLDHSTAFFRTLETLVSVTDAGEVIITRPNVVRWVLNQAFLFSGFPFVYQDLVNLFSQAAYHTAKAEDIAAKVFAELHYDHTLEVMSSVQATMKLPHSAYMALHKAVFVDDPN